MTHRDVAREAARLRREYGLPWPEIAEWLGYRSPATARTAALETANLRELACVDCGVELERTAGSQPERCDACGLERRRERQRERDRRRAPAKQARARRVGYTTRHWKTTREAAIAARPRCADCGSTRDLTGHLANETLNGDHRQASVDDVEVLCRPCHGRRS